MNALDLFMNQHYSNKKPTINMTSWIINQIVNLCNSVSASVAATRDGPVERLHSVCETAFLLYNMIMNNIEYGQDTERHHRKRSKGRKGRN